MKVRPRPILTAEFDCFAGLLAAKVSLLAEFDRGGGFVANKSCVFSGCGSPACVLTLCNRKHCLLEELARVGGLGWSRYDLLDAFVSNSRLSEIDGRESRVALAVAMRTLLHVISSRKSASTQHPFCFLLCSHVISPFP